MTVIKLIFVSLLTISTTTIVADENVPELTALFSRYVDALKTEDWKSAEKLWHTESIECSKRLGISYTDVPIKYDCASPLISSLPAIRAGKADVAVADICQTEDRAKLKVQIFYKADSLTCYYHALRTDAGWLLTPAIHTQTQSWISTRTKYTTVYYNDNSRFNRVACREMDSFIETIGQKLGLSELDMDRLAREGIDYYLCDDSEFTSLTGYDAHGMGDLQFDAIITRHLPHEHELVHLLVNYAMRELPLYTLPFLQEGLACHLGGRWGRAPRVINYTGHLILTHDICPLKDILTFNDFHTKVGTPEISYPVSAIFVDYLINKAGKDGLLNLYRRLSGSNNEVQALTKEEIFTAIESECGLSWPELEREFKNYWPQFGWAGIEPENINITTEPDTKIDSDDLVVSIWNNKNGYLFSVSQPVTARGGVVLFGPRPDKMDSKYRSRLFAEQFPEAVYSGERYGIVFSNAEIGLYDYFCDQVRAKYVSTSPENGLWDAEHDLLNFSLDNTIIGEEDLSHLTSRINKH